MKRRGGTKELLFTLLILWYIAFFAGLVFHFRAVSSISVGLILLTGLVWNKTDTGSFISRELFSFFPVSCFAYFLYISLLLLINDNTKTALRHIELKSALVLIPAAVLCCNFLNAGTIRLLLKYFLFLLVSACLYCIALSVINYMNSGDSSDFFYHNLVSPLKQHAVYFSLLIFFAILYLLGEMKKGIRFFSKAIHFLLIVFFSLFLVLLSSKLVLLFYAGYLVYFFLSGKMQERQNKAWLILSVILLAGASVLVFFTNNPVNKRFREIFQGDIGMVKKDSYSPADYFNGLQFRLLQWRLVPEILDENKSWLTGLGENAGQQKLQEKYISKNMYRGQPGTPDTGYLAYNTHNQLLQSLLTGGITGSILFLLICIALLRMALRQRKSRVVAATVLILFFSMIESCFETQYGLLLFTFFPLFFSRLSGEEAGI
ncbi:MAG: O-antigen ligase family protein [Sphingobacteriales bacterium]|nr:O-antigen ligase family protein [Sphingobacteriales bacterium]